MMKRARTIPWVVVVVATLAACGVAGEAKDPLTAELERWSAFLKSKPADKAWTDVRQDNEPVLARAEEALRSGHRLVALQRVVNAKADLATAEYVLGRTSAQRKDQAAFEAEWARLGGVMRADLGVPSPAALEDMRPAAVRAMGEAALSQVPIYYEASRAYGQATMPDAGLYYLASAKAQRDVVEFLRGLSEPTSRREPPVRSIAPELEALEAEVLAAYRPPASVDRHPEFITLSSALKEARELDAAGLRYGALLRYLQSAQRFAALRPAPPSVGADALKELESRLSAGAAGDVDHSLGQMFLETAKGDATLVPVIAGDVLPRYFAALEPARPQPPKPAPRVTVTLVRWPYT